MSDEKIKSLVGASPVKKFGDIYNAQTPWAATHKQIKDKEVIILKAVKIETGYGMGILADTKVDGNIIKVLFGGKVLIKQLEAVLDELPISATVKKNGRYYTFN